jgi:hypothetical protein
VRHTDNTSIGVECFEPEASHAESGHDQTADADRFVVTVAGVVTFSKPQLFAVNIK